MILTEISNFLLQANVNDVIDAGREADDAVKSIKFINVKDFTELLFRFLFNLGMIIIISKANNPSHFASYFKKLGYYATPVDYAMNDINMRIENLQINIGDLKIPKIPFRIFDGQLFNVSNNVLSVFGCAGSHLFNPFNKFQDLVGQSSWSDPQYTQAVGQPGASNGTFWFSFENLDMIPQESEDTAHSFGVNTFIMGNQIIINGKFSSPATAPVAVHTCYKAQEVLLVGNGQIENVFNKTLVNNVLQIQ